MAIAAGVSAKGRTTGATSQATSAVTTQASGSTFVVAFAWLNTSGTVNFSSIADSKGNTYTQIGTEVTFDITSRARLYYCQNGTGGATHTATVTLSGSTAMTVFFQEITGGATTGILDQSIGRADAASPYTLAAGLTTTQAAELLLSFMASNSGSNPATNAETGLGSSTIQVQETDGTQFYTGGIATSVKSSTGTFNPSWTSTGSSNAAVYLATFKAAAGLTLSLTGTAVAASAGTMVQSRELTATGTAGAFSSGAISPTISVPLAGQTGTFSSGTLTKFISITLNGSQPAFSAGAIAADRAVPLVGTPGTFSTGTITIGGGGDITLALTGTQSLFDAGQAGVALSVSLIGQAITVSPGSISAGSGIAISGNSASFSVGSLLPAVGIALLGERANFASGIVTPSGGTPVIGGNTVFTGFIVNVGSLMLRK